MSESFRVQFDPEVISMAGSPFVSDEVSRYAEAELILNAIANYTLLLHERSLIHDYSNAGWIEYKDDYGRWVDCSE